MSVENKAVVRRFFEEIFNQKDLALADEIVAMDYVNHNPAPGESPGREGLKAFVAYLHAGNEEIQFVIEDQAAEDDKVVTRWKATAVHTGEFAGIPATGRRYAIQGINIHRVVNGQMQEGWLEWDALGWMQQVGVMPDGAE